MHTSPALKARLWTTMVISLCGLILYINVLESASAAMPPSDEKEASHIERLQELLETRSFIEQQWRKRRAYPYLERGMRLTEEGRISEAVAEYTKYLSVDPEHYLIHWHRLILLSSAATPAGVITAATEFLYHVPSFGPAYLIRGLALQKTGRTDDAQQDFIAALKDDQLVHDGTILALSELRNIAHKQGDHHQALLHADRLLENDPDSVPFQEYRAVTLERLDRKAEAAAVWAHIAAQTHDRSQRRRALATQAMLLDKIDQSSHALEVLLAMRELIQEPDVPNSERTAFYRILSSVADKVDEIEHAIVAYERVLGALQSTVTANNSAQHDTAALRQRLAELYSQRRQPVQVLRVLTPLAQPQAYQRAGGDAEEYADVLYALAEAARQLSQVEETGVYWRRALRVRDDWRKRLDFAYWLAGLGQLDGALVVLDQGATPNSASSRGRYLAVVAELAEKAGQPERALQALAAALAIDDDRRYREQYVHLLLRAGRESQALPEMQRLAETAADAISRRHWHRARGDVAFKLGQTEIALTAYEQALALAKSQRPAAKPPTSHKAFTRLRLAPTLRPEQRRPAQPVQLSGTVIETENYSTRKSRAGMAGTRLRLATSLDSGQQQRTHASQPVSAVHRTPVTVPRLQVTQFLHHEHRKPAHYAPPHVRESKTTRQTHPRDAGAFVHASHVAPGEVKIMRLQLAQVLHHQQPHARMVSRPSTSATSEVYAQNTQSSTKAPETLDTDTASLRLRLAELYRQRRQPAQILRLLTPLAQPEAYQRAGGDAQQYADVLYALAEAAGQLNRVEEAGAYWHRALRERDDWRTRLDLAYWLAGIGRLDPALAVLDEGTIPNSAPERGRYLAVVAELAEKAGQPERALQALAEALAVEERLKTRLQAAETAWQLNRYEEAGNYLTPVVYSPRYAERVDIRALHHRLCATYEKRGLLRDALKCVEELLIRVPKDIESQAYAAELARLSGLPDKEFDYLKELHALDPKPNIALRIGYLHLKLGQEQEAQPWFRKAYQSGRSGEGGLAYAHSLLKQGHTGIAIEVLSDIVDDGVLRTEQRIQAHAALGYALAETKDFVGASQAWKAALSGNDDPVLALREAWALHRADDIAAASSRLGKIDVAGLPPEEQLTWHDEAGTLRYRTSDFEESLSARQEAVALAPTAERWFRIAETLIALERLQEADDALDRAMRLAPNSPYYAAQRGYLNIALGNHRRVADLFERVVALDEDYIGVAEDLGYSYIRLFENEKAIEAFHQAIDQAQYTPVASDEEQRKVQDEVYRMRRQTDTLERRWQFEFFDSVCLIEDGCQVGFPAVGEPFSVPFGTLAFSYQPPKIGYRDGRVLKLFGRLLWSNEARSLSVNDDSVQAGVGVRYKPFKTWNLWMSMERLIEVGDDSEDNWLARLSWSHSQGIEWRPLLDGETRPANSIEYVNLYADAGKLLSRDRELFLVGEARYGRTLQFGNQWLISPFGYLLGNGTFDNDENDYWVEAGAGASVRLQFGFDRYRGYGRGAELLLRIGRDINNSAGNEENRALVGLRLVL